MAKTTGQLILSGLNIHSAPLAMRERFAVAKGECAQALRRLAQSPSIEEAVILSTCNRAEVYAVVSDVRKGFLAIDEFFKVSGPGSSSRNDDERANFKLVREDVVLHLLRVAAGLNSMILGETQIMAQVKDAHRSALEAGTSGIILNKLFQLALNCGKVVRSKTAIGQRTVSVGSRSVELAEELLGGIDNKSIVVMGAGAMAQIFIKMLVKQDRNCNIFLLNRGKERVFDFLRGDDDLKNRDDQIDAGFSLEERYQLIRGADLVLVAACSSGYLLAKDRLAECVAVRHRPLFIVDISVPRNVDPAIADLDAVRLFYADDLACTVTENLAEREALVADAERIVFDFLDQYQQWQRSLVVVPTLAALHEKLTNAIAEQLARRSKALSSTSNDETSEDRMPVTSERSVSKAIVNGVLHQAMVRLKAQSEVELERQAGALEVLFGLRGVQRP